MCVFCMTFRIGTSSAGDVRIQFKHWSTDDVWRPEDGQPAVEIFTRGANGQQLIPENDPELINPNFSQEEMQLLKQSILKTKVHNNILRLAG
jgi:hypothetical protein